MAKTYESKGFVYSVERVGNVTRVTVDIPDGIQPKGADCVTRTTLAGKFAFCKVAELTDDLTVNITECAYEVSTNDKEKAQAELNRKHPGKKIVVQEIKVKDGETVGIPRDLFHALAVNVTRPDSQKVSK